MKRFDSPLSMVVFAAVMMLLAACGAATPAPTAATAPVATAAPVATTAPAATATSERVPAELPTLPPSPTPTAAAAQDLPFTLSSTAFAEGATIPDQYVYRMTGQCDGANLSPELTWSGAPAGTQSFVVMVVDPDGGDWAHWVQFNIPGDVTALPEAAAGPDIGVKGCNDFGELGYGGPCPPGGTHRYIFTLYALDTTLALSDGATRPEVLTAMKDHIIGTAQLTGLRSR
jgi:Raf kinase inhibitor-like YbhB/YbcL family protein